MRERGGGRPGGRRGVSEVIGVVLLVAIVVVLAGTVAYVVLGVDSGRPPTPQFSKVEDFNRNAGANGQYLNVTHGSGEIVETRDMRLVVEGAVVRERSDDDRVGTASLKSDLELQAQIDEKWRVGEELSINATMFEHSGGTNINSNQYLDLREATVKIVWVPRNEGVSDVLYRWEGPDA